MMTSPWSANFSCSRHELGHLNSLCEFQKWSRTNFPRRSASRDRRTAGPGLDLAELGRRLADQLLPEIDRRLGPGRDDRQRLAGLDRSGAGLSRKIRAVPLPIAAAKWRLSGAMAISRIAKWPASQTRIVSRSVPLRGSQTWALPSRPTPSSVRPSGLKAR